MTLQQEEVKLASWIGNASFQLHDYMRMRSSTRLKWRGAKPIEQRGEGRCLQRK